MVAGHGDEDISPNEKLGFGFIYDTYFDALCLNKEKERHTFDKHYTKGINSHFKNKWEDFTVKVQ